MSSTLAQWLLVLFSWAASHHCLVNQQKHSSKPGPAHIIPYLVLINEHNREVGCWQVDLWRGVEVVGTVRVE